MNSEHLIKRINQLQNTVWDIDDKSKRNLESISKHQIDITEIKSSLALINNKIKEMEIELNNLKK